MTAAVAAKCTEETEPKHCFTFSGAPLAQSARKATQIRIFSSFILLYSSTFFPAIFLRLFSVVLLLQSWNANDLFPEIIFTSQVFSPLAGRFAPTFCLSSSLAPGSDCGKRCKNIFLAAISSNRSSLTVRMCVSSVGIASDEWLGAPSSIKLFVCAP